MLALEIVLGVAEALELGGGSLDLLLGGHVAEHVELGLVLGSVFVGDALEHY